MRASALCVLCLAALFAVAVASTPHLRANVADPPPLPAGCQSDSVPNMNTIYTGDPILLKTVPNGKKYIVGEGDDKIFVVHLWGTPFQMGNATGILMRDELRDMIPTYFKYLDEQVDQYVKFLPKDIADWIINVGLGAALDLTAMATKPYNPARFNEEIEGLAAGSGLDAKDFTRLNMLPELVKAGCSMFGAWGPATANNANPGRLVQLRALDWDVNAPIKKYPTVLVYHTQPGDGHPFINIAWPGFVGSITGYSSAPIGLSEKVWLSDPSYDTRFGEAWTYVYRDLLQYAVDLDDALTAMANANRTCSVHIGVGDGNANTFRGVEYSYKYLNIWDDVNQPTYPAHPRMSGLVYWDKHKQPSNNPCFGSLLKQYYGNLSAENTIHYVTALEKTGDTQVAVYDFATNMVYTANPRADGESGPLEAFQRQYVRLDMTKIFAESSP